MLRQVLLGVMLGVVAAGPAAAGDDKSDESQTVTEIPEFSAVYELRRNNLRAAELTRTLSCEDDGRCRFSSKGRTVGFADVLLRGRIDEFTRFRLDADGIHARDYSYRQRARGGNDEYVRLFFNPATGRVNSRGDDEWQDDIEGEVMDELLSQLRLAMAVRDGQTEMEFTVVEGDGEREVYRFEVQGTDRIETNAGTFDAVKVQRVGGSERRTTTMWFAPELEYIPVVVKQEHVERENYTATLKEIKSGPELRSIGG